MRLDLHNHTVYSPDSSTSVADAVKAAIAAGLDGLAITDHNSVRGSLEAEKIADGRIVIIRGAEVSTTEGHLLCLGIGEDIDRGLGMAETIERAVSAGGVAVPSHPFRLGTGCGEKVLNALHLSAVECINGRNLKSRNARACRYAAGRGLGSTGGSDSHSASEIGRAFTVVDGEGLGASDILALLAAGKCTGAGTGQSLSGSARTLYKIVTEYLRRGRHI